MPLLPMIRVTLRYALINNMTNMKSNMGNVMTSQSHIVCMHNLNNIMLCT